MGDLIELELPARPDYLALARLIVAAAARHDPTFAADRIDDLRLAVSEACTNAMEAQQRAFAVSRVASRILIRCLLNEERVQVEVHDQGTGFDPDGLVPHPPITDPARLDHERGLGIPLIKSLTDEVEFRPSGNGTMVRMVLYTKTLQRDGADLPGVL